ncbi:MAG: response regulator [Verrucomicrobiota bacterium]
MSIGLPEEENSLQSPPSPGNAGILVVDEDPAFQLGLKTFLKEYVGFDQVFAARSGQEALELIESEESIDVLTLDYQMPGMDGIEVMKELSDSAPRPLSVMMITGYPSEELETEFRSFASPTLLTDYFLHKPVEFEKLEPLVLKAHEDLLAARVAAEETVEDEDVEEALGEPAPSDLKGIETSLFRQETKLDALTEKVRVLRQKSRRDSILLALLLFAVGAAIHFGWFGVLETAWKDARSDFQEVFSKAPLSNSSATNEGEAEPPPVTSPASEAETISTPL